MKKNIIILLIGAILLFSFTGCSNDKENLKETDASKFKKEYEKLNGENNEYNNKEYRTLEIEEDNPFIYKEANDIVEMMDEKETFVVYFGFASCPWCRSAVPTLIEVASDLGINTIYYVDVKDIRNTITIDEDGTIKEEKEGTDAYYKLLEKMDSILEEYALTDEDGEEVSTNEKRIYAPNIVSVVDGKALKLTDGISEEQDDAYMELTTEMMEDAYDKIKCSIECVVEEKEICKSKTKC